LLNLFRIIFNRRLNILLIAGLLFASIFGVCLSFTGCASSNSSSSWTQYEASGQLILPTGCALTAQELRVVTCLGEAPVSTTGAFTALEPGQEAALATVVNSAGTPVLYGFVASTTRQAGQTIDARSTAAALLFVGLQAFTMPAEYRAQLLQWIDSDPHTATLAMEITQRMAINPTAVADADAEIITALTTAVTEITTATRATPAMTRPRATRATDLSLYKIVPDAEQSGMTCTQNTANNGMLLTNKYRRHTGYYIYRTGYTDKDSVRHDLSAADWVRITTNNAPWDCLLPATDGWSGAVSEIFEVVAGTASYTATTTGTPILPLEPSDAKETYYTLVACGSTFGVEAWTNQLGPQSLPADLVGNPNTSTWAQRVHSLSQYTAVKEVIFPAVAMIIPADAIKKVDPKIFFQVSSRIITLCTDTIPGFGENLIIGDARSAMAKLFSGFAGQQFSTLTSILSICGEEGLLQGTVATQAATAAKFILQYVGIIDKVMSSFDLLTVVRDNTTVRPVQSWNITCKAPTVRLQPETVEVAPGGTKTFTTYGVAEFTGSKEYKWSTAGKQGSLSDTHGQSGSSFTSADQTITYTANDTAEDKSTDIITVQAYLVQGTKLLLIGTADAVVTIKAPPQPINERYAYATYYNFPATGDYEGRIFRFMIYKGPQRAVSGIAHYPRDNGYYNGLKYDGRYIVIDLPNPPDPGPYSTLEWNSMSRDEFLAKYPLYSDQVVVAADERVVVSGGGGYVVADSLWSLNPALWRKQIENSVAARRIETDALTFDFAVYVP